MNKFQQSVYQSYIRADGQTSLRHVYKSWSDEKEEAYNYCLRIFREHYDASDFRIISANGWKFSVGFYFTDKDTGVAKFCYITKEHIREWEI